MATSGYWFESGPIHMTDTYSSTLGIDWNTDIGAGKVKAILTYGTSPDTHYQDWLHYSDVIGELTTGGGYTAGGKALATPTVGMVTDTDRYVRYGAANVSWAASFTAGPFRWMIFYKDTGTASTSPLVGWHNMGSDTTGAGGDFTYQFDTLGGVFRSKVPHP